MIWKYQLMFSFLSSDPSLRWGFFFVSGKGGDHREKKLESGLGQSWGGGVRKDSSVQTTEWEQVGETQTESRALGALGRGEGPDSAGCVGLRPPQQGQAWTDDPP